MRQKWMVLQRSAKTSLGRLSSELLPFSAEPSSSQLRSDLKRAVDLFGFCVLCASVTGRHTALGKQKSHKTQFVAEQ